VDQDTKHLTIDQIEYLIKPQPRMSEDSAPSDLLEEAHRHLVMCDACQRLVSMHKEFDRSLRQLRKLGLTNVTSDCPPELSLDQLVAGLLTSEEAENLLKHIVQCDNCGGLLRDVTGILSDEILPEEELVAAELHSGQPDWQKNLVARLNRAPRDTNPVQPGFEWWDVFNWPRWVFATIGFASALLLLTGSAFWLWTERTRVSEANQLVLQSYAEHRTVRPRFPGAQHALITEFRSGGQRPFSETPWALREAEKVIARGLQSRPNDPTWLQLKARADMLEGDANPAVASLESALAKKPRDSSLKIDLATAYFQTGDYERAVEILTGVLQSEPSNLVALFNRAMALESQHRYREAIADWTRYLELDPAGDWSLEARQHLENARTLVNGN